MELPTQLRTNNASVVGAGFAGHMGRLDASMTAPEYGPPRRVYGECDCPENDSTIRHEMVYGLAIPNDCAAATVIAYERDRLVDCPEGCVVGHLTMFTTDRCPTCPDEHPGKVVAKCSAPTTGVCVKGRRVFPPTDGLCNYDCPDCNRTGVETQRITRERVMEVIRLSVHAGVPFVEGEYIKWEVAYAGIDSDEAAFVLAILEAGLL